MLAIAKQAIRRTVAHFGYTVRHVGDGHGMTGVDALEDIRIRLGRKSGAVLFDVGANHGDVTAGFLSTFADPRIIAFEPSPGPFANLQALYREHPNVRLENMALADREGPAAFHVTRDYSVNDSLLNPVWDAHVRDIEVAVQTVDGYCEREGIPAIDLLKIDTQGCDLNVLRGARRMLEERLISLYLVEVMFVPMYEGQPSLVDFLEFADEHRYRLMGLYEQTYVSNRLGYLNACFEQAG